LQRIDFHRVRWRGQALASGFLFLYLSENKPQFMNRKNLILLLAIVMEIAGILLLVKGSNRGVGITFLCVGVVFLIIGMTSQKN
jgi:TRAP-type uncharacterized transport system fused permease subunit